MINVVIYIYIYIHCILDTVTTSMNSQITDNYSIVRGASTIIETERYTKYFTRSNRNVYTFFIFFYLSRKIISSGEATRELCLNNSYAFLGYFHGDLRGFLSGIWRRSARPCTCGSRRLGACVRVYVHACARARAAKEVNASFSRSFTTLFRSRCLRCEIASDIGTLISVTGDNEPTKGCRAIVKSLLPAVSKSRREKAKEMRDGLGH